MFACRLDAFFLCKIRGMIYGSLFLRLLIKRSSKYRKRGENVIPIVANLGFRLDLYSYSKGHAEHFLFLLNQVQEQN